MSQAERRIAEAANMGMRRVYLAERGVPKRVPRDVEVVGVRTIQDAVPAAVHVSRDVTGVRDVGVVIVAGGSEHADVGGTELKQFRWVAGKPMLLHSLQTFMARPDVVSRRRACCRASTPPIRRRGSSSATSTG